MASSYNSGAAYRYKKRNRRASPQFAGEHNAAAGTVASQLSSSFTFEIPHTITVYGAHRHLQITYTNELSTIDLWCASAFLSTTQVFGLDCEHPPNFFAGVATEQITVLQIAVDDRVLVIQINAIASPDGGPCGRMNMKQSKPLLDLFTRPGTSFAGMGVGHDIKEVCELLALSTKVHTIDLKSMAVARDHSMPGGLGPLAIALLGVDKWKSKGLALSRWGEWPLEKRRVVYAAMDAWASGALHAHLEAMPLSAARAVPAGPVHVLPAVL